MEYLGLGGEDLYDEYPQGGGRGGARQSSLGRGGNARGRRYNDEYDDDEDLDEYDSDDDGYDDFDDRPPRRRGGGPDARSSRAGAPPEREARPPRTSDSGVHVRPIASRASATARSAGNGSGEAVSIRPVRFEEAKDIGDLIKAGQAVKMDIGSADEDTARRLIDFASGLVYASEGSIDRIAAGVFVLRPRASRTIRI